MRQKVLLLMLATVFAFASSFAQTKKDVRLPKKVQETLTEMQKSSRKNQSAKTLQRQTDLSRQEGMRTMSSIHQKLNGKQTVSRRASRRADIITEQPAGELKIYARNCTSYYATMFGLGKADVTGAVASVVFADNNKVYFKDLVSQAGLGTWTEGTINGSTITIQLPQQAGFSDYGYGFCVAKMTLDAEQGTYVPAANQTLTLKYDASTGKISTSGSLNSGAEVIGLIYDDDYSWTGYADFNISIAPISDPLVEAPAGLTTETYALQAEGYAGSLVQVGFNGDDVYVQGIDQNLPDTWIKGTIQGDKVIFKNAQYVGADEKAGYHQYLVSAVGKLEYDDRYEDYVTTYSLAKTDIEFTYDANAKTLTNSTTFLLNSGKAAVNYQYVFDKAQLIPFTEVAATPVKPVINVLNEDGWEYFALGYGWGSIDFNINCEDVNGNYIRADKLSYALWIKVNGEEKQLTTSYLDYSNQVEETMTEFPYGYSDGWDVYCTGANSSFCYHVIGPEAFGVQAIYRGGNEEHKSEIAWVDAYGFGSEVQPAAATPAYPEPTINATDKTITFGYFKDSGENIATVTNNSKPETYDVAVKIENAAMVGNYIKSITFPLQETEGVSDINVFLTSQLRVENGKNAADIVVKNVTPTQAGYITVELEKPYLIPEGGVYAGYSLTINNAESEANAQPVAICDKPAQGGFYMHTSDGFLKWLDVSEGLGGSSLLTVDIVGSTVKSDAVVIADSESQYVKAGEAFTLPVTIVNYGGNGATSVNVAYEVAGLSDDKQFNVSLNNRFGASTTVKLEIPAIADAGNYSLKVKATKVNGKDNEEVNVTEIPLAVMKTLPKKRTLLEEYTGTWCGWCPRGYVGLEKLAELYPDEYVLVSYHNSDDMEIMPSSYFPSKVAGFPDSWMDRNVELDAYYGLSNTDFGIAADLAENNKQFGQADITLAAALDANGTINVTTDVTFPYDLITDESYTVEYILTADGLTDPAWGQSNYFAGGSQGNPLYMDQFANGESTVYGLVYNDVAVLTSELKGGANTTIDNATADTPVKVNYAFSIKDIVNTNGASFVKDVTKLKVVVLLIDNMTGTVANANKTAVDTSTGINIVERDNNECTSIYDLMGRRISQPTKGLYITNGRKTVIK